MANDTCPTKLIDDLPTKKDEFGSHEGIADAIADIVRDENGGYAIAIEGTWGSGKSTIIELLKQKLQDQVFVFDAWAHKGDPLRRVFLERLIRFLCDGKHLKPAEWDEKLDLLTHRIKRTTTRSTPRLSTWGTVLAFVTLLIPFGTALFATAFLPDAPVLWRGWQLVAGVLFGAAPLACLLFWLLGKLLHGCYYGFAKSRPKSKYPGLSVLFREAEDETHTQSYETPEPSSAEFEEFFGEAVAQALPAQENRLVIVVDNLDRVPQDNALAVWSTLRVFLEQCARGNNDWSDRVFLIVPYDRSAMTKLWSPGTKPPKKKDGETGEEEPVESDEQVGLTFLQKTFLVRFEVPPLLLSGWFEYLKNLLKQALPHHKDDDKLHEVVRVFHRARLRVGRPTPRELKVFVNDLGTLHRQRGDEFPLSHLAYYVVLRQEGVNVASALLKGTAVHEVDASLLDADVENHLAALYFNSTVDRARSLLLANPIEAALHAGDPDVLGERSQNHGFAPVFENVLRDYPTTYKDEPHALANAGRAIHGCGLHKSSAQPQLARPVRRFCEEATHERAWGEFDSPMAKGLSGYVRLLNDANHSKRILQQVLTAQEQKEKESADEAPERVKSYAGGLIELLKSIRDLGHETAYQEGINVPGSEPDFLAVCSTFAERESETGAFWEFLRPSADPRAVIGHLSPKGGSPWGRDEYRILEVLRTSPVKWPWKKFAGGAETVLGAPEQQPDAHTVEYVLRAMWLLEATHPTIKQLVGSGALHHHLAGCASVPEAAAVCAYSILSFVGPQPEPTAFGQSAEGHQILTAFVSGPGEKQDVLNEYCRLVATLDSQRNVRGLLEHHTETAALVRNVLLTLRQENQLAKAISADVLIDKWSQLYEVLKSAEATELRFQDALTELRDQPGFAGRLTQREFSVGQAGLDAQLVEAGYWEDKEYASWCMRGLRAITKEEWLKQLRSKGTGAALLQQVRRRNTEFVLERAYLDALEQFGKYLLGADAPPDAYDYEFSAICALTDDDREVLRRLLIDALTIHAGKGRGFFALFGDELARDGAELQKENQLVRGIFRDAVEKRHEQAIEWVAATLDQHPDLLKPFPGPEVRDFRRRLRSAVKDEKDDRIRQALVQLAKSAGVKVPDVPQEPDSGNGEDGSSTA